MVDLIGRALGNIDVHPVLDHREENDDGDEQLQQQVHQRHDVDLLDLVQIAVTARSA